MSLRDFWLNVRTSARFIAPNATADSPRLDSSYIERILRGATIWLTPKAVEGFDAQDFNFLSAPEQKTLAESVGRFLDISRQIPSDKPATDQEVQQALPEFQRIVEIIRPDKYADPDAFVLGKMLEQNLAGKIPQSVCELRFETGEDSRGGPALWIWVVFGDEVGRTEVFLKSAKEVRDLLEKAVQDLRIGHWPYVRFRTDSELNPKTSAKRVKK